MKAPEKIYVHVKGDKITNTWNSTWIGVHDVEYIRNNVFIEKAAEYLMEYEFNDSPTIADRRKRVEEFRAYMEEE